MSGNGNADGTFVYTGFRPALGSSQSIFDAGTHGRILVNSMIQRKIHIMSIDLIGIYLICPAEDPLSYR